MKFETKAIHVGQEADPTTGATIVPIYQTSTYTQEAIGKDKGYDYSRAGNPTRSAYEKCLASLENASFAYAFASGCAASSAVCHLLKAGEHMVVVDEVYGGTYRLFEMVMKEHGLNFTFVPTGDYKAMEEAIAPNTKMIWMETPTNPMLTIVDIEKVVAIAKRKNLLTIVDNTFATPYFQKPIDLGVDVIVHSTTKYIGGHSDLIGGAVITNSKELAEKIYFTQKAVGAVPGAFDCWLALRGLKTLALRMERHQENALAVAEFLLNHPKVAKVIFPGLVSHPQHELAKRQMSGFSGMVSFEIKGGKMAADQFATSLKVFSLAESLGGVESLVCYPAMMTHAAVPQTERERMGITEGLIRLSVGIEHQDDLIGDLERALST